MIIIARKYNLLKFIATYFLPLFALADFFLIAFLVAVSITDMTKGFIHIHNSKFE